MAVAFIDDDSKDKLFYLKLEKRRLEKEYESALGDLERLSIKKEIDDIKKEILHIIKKE